MDVPDVPAPVDRRTTRRRAGDAAEVRVAAELRRRGWTVLGRQVRVGRDELDIVAIDPGPPPMAVVIEVRSRRSPRYGCQEERLDEAKVRRLYRAMSSLRATGRLSDGRLLPTGLAWRVDLIALDRGSDRLRHLKSLIPR